MLSHAHQVMYADLLQKCLDAELDMTLPENGSFTKVKAANGQLFWYYKGYRAGASGDAEKRYSKYVGPVADPSVSTQVERFKVVKAGYQERRALVTALIGAGVPSPLPLVGRIVEELWRAGLFRLRAVLVGTAAFQTYSGLLGVRLPQSALMTGDIDVAQFHSISVSVEDSIPPVLDALRLADKSFSAMPTLSSPIKTTRFKAADGFLVEFLTPNQGKNEYSSAPAPMPALGGAYAQPLRYLDFLIHQPVRAVLLHGGGIPVLVPAPERYAVHKLIVSEVRRDSAARGNKSVKDIEQAQTLINAMADGVHRIDLGLAYLEAEARGPKWQQALARAVPRLPEEQQRQIKNACAAALDAK